MPAKLPSQFALGDRRPREHDKTARFLVEPMRDSQPRQRPLSRTALFASYQPGNYVFKRRREGFPAMRPGTLRWVPDCVHAGRLLDYDDVIVQVADNNALFRLPRGPWLIQQFHY